MIEQREKTGERRCCIELQKEVSLPFRPLADIPSGYLTVRHGK